ncbi:valine--tRNA ligase [Candidatus Woesearchaeota archaeon]|nr:valine--tRNA ligase [Candidatus Woesearchaeota archaeon]
MIVKEYNSNDVEKRIRDYWEKDKIFNFNRKNTNPIYSVDTPPPTVSGKMHMGHAFSYSQEDFIVRYKRMNGFNVLFPFGTDDNGLATERLIEKLENVKSSKMRRKDFVKLVLKTLDEIRPGFVNDWKRIGMSCDFDIFYTTINEHCQKISQKSFIELYKMGRQYRKKAPAFHCPECRTAIAQVEMKDEELESKFIDLKFKLENGSNLIVSTTRPELLSACVAVFVNPDDKRYKNIAGKNVIVPLFNFKVNIIEDKRVDIEKGTGVVMCCTFGDSTDAEWYLAYNLPLKEAIDRDGRMTNITGKYTGLKVKEARQKIIENLKKENFIVQERTIRHNVNVHERCGNEIEILESKQWFVRYLDLREQFLKNGKELNWYPEHMRVRLENWINGLQWDWCISRQRHYGIPFPVWYCKKCDNVVLADEKDLPVDPTQNKPRIKKCDKCGCKDFIAETDVLDTWATSSLTPVIIREFFKDDKELYEKIFPMSLRPQAGDIINFWLFHTLVKSQLHYNKNPWKDVMISGFVFLKGEKMSKSKGNIIEPQSIIDKYSADALRFWAASSKYGNDVDFHEKDVVTGQKTLTKMWNTFKFSYMHLENYDPEKPKHLELIDQWLGIKLNKLIKECTESFDNYEYNKSKSAIDNFFWNVFCDFYIEIIKDRIYNEDKRGLESKRSAQYTLYNGFLTILKIFAPIMPYITEEIYCNYYIEKEKSKSIHLSYWPEYDKNLMNKDVEEKGDKFIDILKNVRMEKAKNHKSIKEEIILSLEKKYEDYFDINTLYDLRAVTNAVEIKFVNRFGVEFKD